MLSVERLQNFQKLEEYKKAMGILNEHSAQMREILRAMEAGEYQRVNNRGAAHSAAGHSADSNGKTGPRADTQS